MLDFENTNFDIETFIGRNNLENLHNVSNYLDYALHSTIIKQIPNVDKDDEKEYAKQILRKYLSGDLHFFTSKNNIRNNIRKIEPNRLINLFIKAMIEKHAYDVTVKQRLITNDNSAYVCNMISRGLYSDVITWLKTDAENIEEIMSNYVDFIYDEDDEVKRNLEYLTTKDVETNKAMEKLNLELSLMEVKKR